MAVDLFGPIPQKPAKTKKTAPPKPPPPRVDAQRYDVHRASGNRLWILIGATVLFFAVQALGVRIKKSPLLELDLTGLGNETVLGIFGLIVLGIGGWYFADIVAATFANVGLNRRRKTEHQEVGYRRAVATRISSTLLALVMCLGCMSLVVRYDYWQMRPVVLAFYRFIVNPPPSPFDPPPVPKRKQQPTVPESGWDKWWRENFGIEPEKP